ncbi:sensor histidine kinase [Pedococcus bigeumensis]|uniref:histidine kinase n=1 Tax=Pedococcus bigeumensis TaxID=433644 RepID=A0A502D009_9MICO|nr:HAMP domain-containing sensor histidine kinase [Pedococcus bigeumensis]TPG17351.1 sensor histidine kinase [Pedococcus bigeumensis]
MRFAPIARTARTARFAPTALRQRLVLGGVVVGLVFAALFGAVATWRIHHVEDQAITAALQNRIQLARDEVSIDGSFAPGGGSPKTDLVQVIGPDGKTRGTSLSLAGLPPLTDVGAVRSAPRGVQTRLSLQQPDIDLAVLAVPLRLSSTKDSPAGMGALVVATDAEGFNAASSDLTTLLIGGLACVVIAIGSLSWVLTGRALRSVTRLTESAEAVQPRDLAAGLPIPRGDSELARLVVALNRMLARLDESHAAELAFAANAGHRLRTPVATLRAEAELALRETDPAELTAALERVVHDADQLTSVVDRMLARSRSRSRARDRGPQPVLEVLADARPRWQRQASLVDLELTVRIDDRVTAQTQCVDLVEVVDPIVDNAVRHTPPGETVDIDIRPSDAGPNLLSVCVSNTGEPVPADLAAHVFDAWVSSRDASVAGGLGLWLSRETAREQGGDVFLIEDAGSATTFCVVLPTTDTISWLSDRPSWWPT